MAYLNSYLRSRYDPPTWQEAEQVLQSQGLGFHLRMSACNGDKHKIPIENQTCRFEHLICPRTKELDNASILTKVGDGLGRHAKPVKTFRYPFQRLGYELHNMKCNDFKRSLIMVSREVSLVGNAPDGAWVLQQHLHHFTPTPVITNPLRYIYKPPAINLQIPGDTIIK